MLGNKPLPQLKYAVFALGSSLYETFCAFGRNLDQRLELLQAERLLPVCSADELTGQEPVFQDWAEELRSTVCRTLGLDNVKTASTASNVFDVESVRLVRAKDDEPAEQDTQSRLTADLGKAHRKQLMQCQVASVNRLQPPDYPKQTVLVKLVQPADRSSQAEPELAYQPGDHLGVLAENPPALVDRLMAKLRLHTISVPDLPSPAPAASSSSASSSSASTSLRDLPEALRTAGTRLRLQRHRPGAGWRDSEKLPAGNLRTWFSQYVDICAPPSQRFLALLRPFVHDPLDVQRLEKLAQSDADYSEWKLFHRPNLIDLFSHLPSLVLCKFSAPFTRPSSNLCEL